jgi:DNA-binding transcriptional MerR regulator
MWGLDSGVYSRLYAWAMGIALLQIGQVARKTGLSVDAIRFYERSGLLPRPARTLGGYRLYEEREIADLEFIQKAQQLGFSLSEIRELFSIQRHPHEVCEHVRELIAQKLTVVRAKIAELQGMETALAGALRQCRTALRQPSKHQDSCPVLEAITKSRPQRKKHEG